MKKSVLALSGLALFAYSAMAADGQKAITATKGNSAAHPQKIGAGKCPLCYGMSTSAKTEDKQKTEKVSIKKEAK